MAIRPQHVTVIALLQVLVAAGGMLAVAGILCLASLIGAPGWFIVAVSVLSGLVFLAVIVSAGIAAFNSKRSDR